MYHWWHSPLLDELPPDFENSDDAVGGGGEDPVSDNNERQDSAFVAAERPQEVPGLGVVAADNAVAATSHD